MAKTRKQLDREFTKAHRDGWHNLPNDQCPTCVFDQERLVVTGLEAAKQQFAMVLGTLGDAQKADATEKLVSVVARLQNDSDVLREMYSARKGVTNDLTEQLRRELAESQN